jgi:hypothetical protein
VPAGAGDPCRIELPGNLSQSSAVSAFVPNPGDNHLLVGVLD